MVIEIPKSDFALSVDTIDALKKSEERYFSLFQNAPIGIAHTSPDGKYLRVNPALAKLDGFASPEDMLARVNDLESQIYLEAGDRRKFVADVLNEDGWVHRETRFRRAEGETGTAKITARKVLKADGTLDYIETFIEDITERKRAGNALRESEQRFRKVFEEAPLGMALCDSQCRFLTVNSALRKMLGYSESELQRLSMLDITYPADVSRSRRYVDKLINLEISQFRTQKRYLRKDGQRILGETTVTALRDAENSFQYALVMVQNVTERKTAEDALKQSRQFSSDLLVNLPHPVLVINRNGIINYVNPAFEKLTGYSSQEVVGHAMPYPYWPRDEAGQIMNQINLNLKNKVRYNKVERLFHKKTGELFWVEVTMKHLPDARNTFKYRIVSWLDITDRKLAEIKLVQSAEAWITTFDAIDDLICIIDKDFRIVRANTAFNRAFQPKAGTLIGRPCYEIVHHSKDRGSCYLNTQQPSRQTVNEYFEPTLGRSYELVISPILDENGRFAAAVHSMRDITERKKIEQSLSQSEAFNFRLMTNAPHPILVYNPDLSIRYINPALQKLTGFTAEELVGKGVPYPFWPKKKIAQYKAAFVRRIKRHFSKLELLLCTKDGKPFWIEINSTPVKEGDQVKFFIANWLDITERKKMDKEIRQSREQLRRFSLHLQEQLEIEKKHLSREIHDELGQMLTGLKIDLSWLTNKLPPQFNDLKQRAGEMAAMLNESEKIVKRISANLRPPMLDDMGLLETVRWFVQQFQTRTGIDCQLQIDKGNPVMDRDFALDIFRIVQEALTNVSRHSGATGVKILLRLKDDNLMLQIHDNGRGARADELADQMAFGLTGMRERAHRWGGDLKIKGSPGKGTTLRLKLAVKGGKNA